MSDDDDVGFGGMFTNAAEDEQAKRLAEERNRVVPIHVPRFRSDSSSETDTEGCPPLVLLHRPAQSHSLWGNLLWNAARHLVYLMDTGRIAVKGRSVLELGAGVAAPSIVAALHGARMVAATDYPDEALLRVVAENAAKALVVDEAARLGETFNWDKMDPRVAAEARKMMAARDVPAVADPAVAPGSPVSPDGGGVKTEKQQQPATAGEAATAAATKGGKRLPFIVDGLCWGNEEDILRVQERAGTSGFDVVFLSDLLFNHICHDTLLATVSRMLSRDPAARAYVTFSFHRAHKRLDDLRFFDKCSFYGLRWALLETNNNYPLMFPDDPGDPAVRKPVYLYELRLADTDVLDKTRYDVVVQGTGMVETLVSASCARAGLSVLHVDAQASYGSGFASGTRKELAGQLLSAKWGGPQWTRIVTETPCSDRLGKIVEQEKAEAEAARATTAAAASNAEENGDEEKLPPAESEAAFSLKDANAVLESRQMLLDAFTTPFLASSGLVEAIAHSQMAEHVEFQNVNRVVGLIGRAGAGSDAQAPKVLRVPVTRKDVFNTGTSVFSSPLEARRMMRFVQDITERSALEKDTDVHRERHGDEIVAGLQLKHPGIDLHATSIAALLCGSASPYNFSPALFDIVTLGGALVRGETPAAAAVLVIFSYLSSIGRYGGATPFLAPMYSASDLPQIFSRMSAVWGALFALQRSVVGVVRMPAAAPSPATALPVGLTAAAFLSVGDASSGGAAGSSSSSTTAPIKNDISLPPTGTRIVLDNGQHVHAKCLIVPRAGRNGKAPPRKNNNGGGAGAEEELVRCIIVSKKPLVSWALLEGKCADAPLNEEDARDRMQLGDPICVGYASLKQVAAAASPSATPEAAAAAAADTAAAASSTVDVSASFCQWTELLQQTPRHIYTTHITARRFQQGGQLEITPEAFLAAVKANLFVDESSDQLLNNNNEEGAVSWSRHVLFAASFFWGDTVIAAAAVAPSSEALQARMSSMDKKDFSASVFDAADALAPVSADDDTQQLTVLEMGTVFQELNDNLIANEAERVFRAALRACGRTDTQGEMPIIKGKDTPKQEAAVAAPAKASAEEATDESSAAAAAAASSE